MSVTAAKGFSASGVASGIKGGGVPDLCLVVADEPAAAAAVFTVNRAAAPPVDLSRKHLEAFDRLSAIVANSGCANAGTGAAGLAAAVAMARTTSDLISRPVEEVLVASTGPIGPALPVDVVVNGIATAYNSLDYSALAGSNAAEAILTTDQETKEVTVTGSGFTVGGMAKGSGMIRPDMATMLAFITTDAIVDQPDLRSTLMPAVDESFHALNIDGCASTNDTVAVLSSGASGTEPSRDSWQAALTEVCLELSKQMAADAEGARRVVTIEVAGTLDDAAARSAGRAIADSVLVRTSFFGGDPNWGRMLGALGASDVEFDPASFGVTYQGIAVARGGTAADYDHGALLQVLESGDLKIGVTVGSGPGRASVLTNDLTPDYVLFNGELS